jgi:S-adenosylmethionine:tRNA ribosyltransferase-isomerase
MSVKQLKIQDFTYDLPDERIAKYPLEERDASKLLIYRNGSISENTYRNITEVLAPESLVLFNNTRVIPARLQFTKPTGAAIEIFCLEPAGELFGGLTQAGEATWVCMVGNAKRWKDGEILSQTLTINGQNVTLIAAVVARASGGFTVRFTWSPSTFTFAEILSEVGQIPLPPYLHRDADDADRERYQTIYARFDGSVAAPTAGLHFTERIFNDFKIKNIKTANVTLHVGAGTFKPVKSETIGEHDMHAEYFDISLETLMLLRGQLGKPIIAVGTTTLRTLESAFLMGSKLVQNPNLTREQLEITQWDAYESYHAETSVADALSALIKWLHAHELDRIVAKTQLLIAPGYTIRTIDALVTNFHQPQSTLLLLVSALVGDAWRMIYDYALAHDFRFLSYGDGSILYK